MKNLIRISLAVAALVGAQVVGAQTKTITLSVTGSGGDRDMSADGLQVQEGDRITITTTANNFDLGDGAQTGCLSFTGTATAGTDFVSTGAVPRCTTSQYRASVSEGNLESRTYTITDDSTSEPAETIELMLTGAYSITNIQAAHAAITAGTPSSIAVTILASDAATVSIARTGAVTLNEGQSAEFTVTMSAANAAAVTVPYSVAGSGAYNVASADQSGSVTIPAGDTTATLSLALPVDGTLEAADADQTITVTLTADDPATTSADEGPTAATNGGAVTRTTTVAGQSAAVMVNFVDTARTLTVTGPATFAETDANAETGNYTITLAGTAFASATTVTWTVTDGTTENADFVAATDRTGTVSFATSDADGATKTFTLTVAGDDLNEAGETFSVQISVADSVTDGGTATGSPATTTITDDDPITASLSAAAVDEGDTVTVNLDHTPTRPVTVAYTLGRTAATDDTDADLNADLSVATRRVTFPANATPAAMTLLTVTDDVLTEPAETFTVAITSAQISGAYGAATGDSETYTIAANDPIAAVITAAETDVAEGGNAVLTVDLGAVAGGAVMVAYTVAVTPSTSDRDATVTGAGVDFTDANSGSITIAAGQRRGTITLAIVDDTVNESEETFQVTIADSDITGGGTATIMSGGTTVFTIAESDPFTFSISADQSITEADTGDIAVTAEFTVTLSGGASTSTAAGDTEVVFSVADASTAASSDYTISPASRVTFDTDADEPDLTQTITVTVTADDMNEAAETVIIELSVVESRGGAGGLSFTVDSGFAADGNTAGRSSATLTINDDDRINLAIAVDGSQARRVEEGAEVTFEVQLSGGAPSSPVSFRYAISGVSAADYHDPNGGLITLPATTTANAMVDFGHAIVINVDAQAEPDETLTLRITDAGAHTGDAPATFTAAQRARVNFGGPTASESVTINANPAAARSLAVTVAAATDCAAPAARDAEFDEGDSVTFCVAPDTAFTAAATLNWTVVDGSTGTAVADDFTSRTGSVSFAATDGTTAKTFTVAIADERVNEPAQTFSVRVTAAMSATQGGTVAGISPTVTIAANDPVEFYIANHTASITEGGQGSTSVTMANGDRLTAPLTIPYTLTGTATRGVDYTATGEAVLTGTLSHAAPIHIETIGDTLNEADETVIITLDHANARMPGGGEFMFRGQVDDETATITIDDNDAVTATFASTTATANEGETVTLTLNLDTASSGPITAVYTVMAAGTNPPEFTDPGSTSSPGASTRTGQIIIPAGETSGDIVLYINTDSSTDTGTGTLTVSNTMLTANYGGGLSNMLTAASTDAVVTVTFRPIPRNFSVAVADSTTDRDTTTAGTQVNEGDAVTFTITLTATGANAPTTRATVGWATMGMGGDVTRSGTVTLANGGSQAVTIAVPVDNEIEAAESLTVNLSPPANAPCFGDSIGSCNTGIGTGSASVTVRDDSTRAPTITLRGPTGIAEDVAATYTVTLNQTPAAAVSVSVSVTGDPMNCSGAACITVSPTTVTLNADDLSGMFTVTAGNPGSEPTPAYNITVAISLTSGEMAGGTVALTTAGSPLTVRVVDREPEQDTARRVQRLKAPLESLARSVGQLAAGAIGDRLRTAATPGDGPLTIGGKTVTTATAAQRESAAGAWADNPHVRNGVNLGLGGGDSAGSDMKEILAKTSFAISHGGHGGGLWASGGRISSDGDSNSVRYNSDTTSWHVGFDRVWNNGLLGVSLAHTDSEIDIDDTMLDVAGAAYGASKLESDLLSVHPYMTGQLDGGGWVWATIGYGTGDAELTEPDPTGGTLEMKTDVEVVTAGIGAEIAPVEGIKLHLAGTVANAKLDGGEYDSGRVTLRSVNGTALRANAGLEGGVTRQLDGGTVLRPFITLSARVDSGDGHDGTSLDWGGGLDARTADGLFARVEGRWQVDGKGPDEEILSLTIRQEDMWSGSLAPYARMNLDGAATGLRLQRGRFGLDMEVGMDNADGVGLERLLQGRWLF